MNREGQMTVAVVLLCLAWFVVVVFHLYTRHCARRSAAADSLQAHHHDGAWDTVSCSRGLDIAVLNAIPTFVYESSSEGPPLECAVCLSEFENKETGRVMPDCNHRFHVECIDMWLQSHCDCPLCRTRVGGPGACDPADPVENSSRASFVSVPIPEPGVGWRSGMHSFLLMR